MVVVSVVSPGSSSKLLLADKVCLQINYCRDEEGGGWESAVRREIEKNHKTMRRSLEISAGVLLLG